jgi:hypothetical protein
MSAQNEGNFTLHFKLNMSLFGRPVVPYKYKINFYDISSLQLRYMICSTNAINNAGSSLNAF